VYSCLKDIAILHWNEKKAIDLKILKCKKGQYQKEIVEDILTSPVNPGVSSDDL
jgi:hypothetical protein